MTPPHSEERALLYLTGQMTSEEAAAFVRELAAASAEERDTFAQWSDTAALLALASVPAHKAPPSAREAIMQQAGITAAKPAPVDDYTYLMDSEGWVPSPEPGVRIKPLFTNAKGGHRVFLLEIQPGIHLPEHPHVGYEECLILRGDLVNEGHRLGPGDYVRAAAGTHHTHLFSETGCVCVIIASAA